MSTITTLYEELGIPLNADISFLDLNLKKDTRMFIDPINILSNTDQLSLDAKAIIQEYFSLLITHVSKWEETISLRLLTGLKESWTASSLTKLGYSKNKNWKAIGPDKAKQIYNAIRKSWVKDLKWIEDLTLLIEWIDKDNVSDLITNLIWELLIKYSMREIVQCNWITKIKKGLILWDSDKMEWIKWDRELPYIQNEYIILTPKNLVRKNFLLNVQKILTHLIVPFEQEKLLKSWSALCRLLRDGTKGKPLVRDIRNIIDCTKSQVILFIQKNPELLEKYKNTLLVKSR